MSFSQNDLLKILSDAGCFSVEMAPKFGSDECVMNEDGSKIKASFVDLKKINDRFEQEHQSGNTTKEA